MDNRTNLGYACGISAFAMWGVFPLYFKWITASATPMEVLVHRILWSAPVLIAFLLIRGRFGSVKKVLLDRKAILTLALTAVLIGINWLLFIYAIERRQTLQASLGYFINPLLNVALGVLILGERLNRVQMVSLLLAGASATYLTMNGEGVPWIALSLAFSFGFYGLLRKTVAADSASGLFIETAILAPFVLVFGIWQAASTTTGFASSPSIAIGLILAGPMTVAPLLLFTSAARHLPLSTMGFLQYLAPTLQFLIAVCVFREPFDNVKMTSFALIWIALIIFATDLARKRMPIRVDGTARATS